MYARSSRVKPRQRDRQAAGGVLQTEYRACRGPLEARHIAVGDDVRLQLRERTENVRVAEADADHLFAGGDRVTQDRGPVFRNADAVLGSRTNASVKADDDDIGGVYRLPGGGDLLGS